MTVYALALPQFGKAFVSDTFSVQGLPQEKGGFETGVDLGKLISGLGKKRKGGSSDRSILAVDNCYRRDSASSS